MTLPLFSTILMTAGTALFVVDGLFLTLYWVYVWQLKEYRSDRMRDFLHTRSGQRSVLNVWSAAWFVFGLYFFFVYRVDPDVRGWWLQVGHVLIVLFLLSHIAVQIHRRTIPVRTMKALLLSILSVVILYALPVGVSSVINDSSAISLSLFLTPIIVSAVVLLLQPLTSIQKQRVIRDARKKISTLSPIVVGITGSYGKSTTKEYVVRMLQKRYSVVSTPKNVNVDIGVARTILDDLQSSHDVFVVEMGAYREGEIQAICNLVSPIIGVLTAINEQHLSLFGSVEAIQRTKGELIRSLPPSGVAIVNRDIPACVQIANDATAPAKFFSVDDVAHVYATSVVARPHDVQFELHVGAQKRHVRAPLYGQQVVPSILAAAAVADHLGVPFESIVEVIEQLEPIKGTMQLRRGRGDAVIVDDSYNSNPDGFLAALDYLALFEGKKKVVVTPGMLELGTESDAHHRTVGSRIGEVADLLVVTKQDSALPLFEAAHQSGLQEEAVVVSDSVNELLAGPFAHCDDTMVVLIEGRVQKSIMEQLIHE